LVPETCTTEEGEGVCGIAAKGINSRKKKNSSNRIANRNKDGNAQYSRY